MYKTGGDKDEPQQLTGIPSRVFTPPSREHDPVIRRMSMLKTVNLVDLVAIDHGQLPSTQQRFSPHLNPGPNLHTLISNNQLFVLFIKKLVYCECNGFISWQIALSTAVSVASQLVRKNTPP